MRYPTMTSTSNRGFSLIEMMIAITIGMFILVAMVLAYTSGKQTYRVQENLSRVQENGRFAIETIARDIRMADFNGCYSKSININNTVNTATSFTYNFNQGLQGNEATSGSAWTPALDASISGASPSPKGGTDVITIRTAQGTGVYVTQQPSGSNLTAADVQVGANNGFSQFDIVLVSNCSGSDVFQISNANPNTSGSLAHNTGVGTPGNSTASLSTCYGPANTSGTTAGCSGPSEVLKIVTMTYFVGQSSCVAANTCVAGASSLWRMTGTNAPEELAEGVDDLQILYGEDTDGDLTANKYVTANNVGNMKNVMSVRINLLLRTLDNNIASTAQTYVYPTAPDANSATITATDKRLRRILTTVVTLRNHTL